MPVGRVKLLNPEGHSGHLRLQLVVGSMESVVGKPQCMGFLSALLSIKDRYKTKKLAAFLKLKW
jgi:hypothetical protein